MKDFMMSDESEEKPGHNEAKMQVLKELREMAMQMMGDKMPGAKPDAVSAEVSVEAAPAEGLEAMLSGSSEDESSMPGEEMELEEIEAQIAELEEMRRAKLMKA